MSHTYLLEIYKFVNQRLAAAEAELTDYEKGDPHKHAMEGRINALYDLKAYLSRNFDTKLPRRIYKQLRLHQEFPQSGDAAHHGRFSRGP